jgi:PAS domain S-box-containing protein
MDGELMGDEFSDKVETCICPINAKAANGNEGIMVGDLYRILVENMQEAVAIFDLPGKCIFANKAAEKLTGYSQDEILGKKARNIIPHKYWLLGRKMNKMALRGESVPYFVMEIKRKDGSLVPVETGGQVIKVNGKIAGIMIITRDITERNKTQVALEESEARYRDIVELAPDIIATSDLRGAITSFNSAGERISGYSRNEVIGKHFSQIGHMQEKNLPMYLKMFNSLVRGKVPEPLETVFIHKNGTPRLVDVRVSLLKQNGKPISILAIMRDITEKKKQDNLLKETVTRFQTLIQAIPDMVYFKDTHRRHLIVNKALEDFAGLPKEKILGKTVEQFLPPELTKQCLESDREVLEKRITVRFEKRSINKKGVQRFFETIKVPIFDENNHILGIVGVTRDITDRKKAELTIRENQQKFERLFRNIPEGAIYWDSEFRVVDINPRFTELFGYTLDEIKGKNNVNIIVPRDKTEEARFLGEKAKEGYLDYDTVRKRKDGSLIPVSLSTAPMVVEGQLLGYVGLYKNITDRKEMERKLRLYSEHLEELVQERTEKLLESEKRYSVLVEEASDGVVIVQDERVAFANKRCTEIFGYPQSELVGIHYQKLTDEKYKELVKERYDRRLKGEKFPSTYEIEVRTKSGERIPAELSATRIDYQGRPANLIIFRDIRERKKTEEEHLKLERLATIGELATMVAHDLRNPLTSIRNASFYIKNTCAHKDREECKSSLEMLNIIEHETISAENIINDLLDFATKRQLQKREQNVSKIMENTLSKVKLAKDIRVEKEFAKKATAPVDEGQLERVFLNIIKNAVQAMPQGGKLTVKTVETRGYVEISFMDTGIGISQENMSKIFQPLFTTKAKGIGIGLAICKKIIEQHDGTINVESKVGEGTILTIKLPRKEEVNIQ